MRLSRRLALTAVELFKAGDGPERFLNWGAPLLTYFVLDGASDEKRIAIAIFVFMALMVLQLCWKEVARRHSEPKLAFRFSFKPMRLGYSLVGNEDARLGSAQSFIYNQPDIRTDRATAKGAYVTVGVYDPQKIGNPTSYSSVCPWEENITHKRLDQRTLDLSPNGLTYGFYPLLMDGVGGVYIARPNDFHPSGATTKQKMALPRGTFLLRFEAVAENMEQRPSKWFRVVHSEESVVFESVIAGLNLDKPADRDLWLSFDGDLKNGPWKALESGGSATGEEAGTVRERTPEPSEQAAV